MKKAFYLTFFAFIIAVVYAHKSNSAITPLYNSPTYSSGASQTPTPQARSDTQYPCCDYSCGGYKGTPANGGTQCSLNTNTNNPFWCAEEDYNKCVFPPNNNMTVSYSTCHTDLNDYYSIGMGELLEELRSNRSLYSSFETEENENNAKARVFWINKYPFNLYKCCYQSIAAKWGETYIFCEEAATPREESDIDYDNDPNLRVKPTCSAGGSDCYSTDWKTYALINIPNYTCRPGNDILNDPTNTGMPSSGAAPNDCCQQNNNVYCYYPGCNFTQSYLKLKNASVQTKSYDSSIVSLSFCFRENKKSSYSAFPGGTTTANQYSPCPASDANVSASFDNTKASEYNYGICKIVCRPNGEYCAAWRTFSDDEICEKIVSYSTVDGFLWAMTDSGSNPNSCVKQDDKKVSKVSQICIGYKTMDLCTKSGGTVDKNQKCTDENYIKSNYNNIGKDDDMYKCSCGDGFFTLDEWQNGKYYNNGKKVALEVKNESDPARTCISDCTEGQDLADCKKYTKDNLQPKNPCVENYKDIYPGNQKYTCSGEYDSEINVCYIELNEYKYCNIKDDASNIEDSLYTCDTDKVDIFYDSSKASNENYGICSYTCLNNDDNPYCAGWMEYGEDEICEDIVQNSINRGYDFYSTCTGNQCRDQYHSAKACARKQNNFTKSSVVTDCSGYYTEQYCTNTLKGQKFNFNYDTCTIYGYNKPNTTVYRCSCPSTYETLAKLGLKRSDVTDEDLLCNRECINVSEDENCLKIDPQEALNFLPSCEDAVAEKNLNGYHAFIDPTSKCFQHSTECPHPVGGWKWEKGSCQHNGNLASYWYNSEDGTRWVRQDYEKYCAQFTKGKFEKIRGDAHTGLGYTDANGTNYSNIGGGKECFCGGDGDAYKYIPPEEWIDSFLRLNGSARKRYQNTHIINYDPDYGFCLVDPFTNVPINQTPQNIDDKKKLYMFDAIQCSANYKTTNEDFCSGADISNLSLGAHLNNVIIREKGSLSKETLCTPIYTAGDQSDTESGFCDIEYLLTKDVKERTVTDVEIKPIKYRDFTIGCEDIEKTFFEMGISLEISDSSVTSMNPIPCYTKQREIRYIHSCPDEYTPCDDDPEKIGDKTKKVCNFYGKPLYESCRVADCDAPSKNVAIVSPPKDNRVGLLKQAYGTDAKIKKCMQNGEEKYQITCDTLTHDNKCEYPYTPVNPNSWCRIADSGELNSSSPKVYKRPDNSQPTCSLDFSECGKEISNGNNREAPSSTTLLTVTKTAAECQKLYGTGAKVEKCREKNSSNVKYNCFFDAKDYIYTTGNCPVGNDLSIPYILKNGKKYWNRCDCAPVYKYTARNCVRGLSGQVCVQKKIDQHFIDNRSQVNLIEEMNGATNVKFYTNCIEEKSGNNKDPCTDDPVYQTWPTSYYNCPLGTIPTGYSIVDKCGKTRYECKKR